MELNQSAINILGDYGIKRFKFFVKELPGWYLNSEGEILNPLSVNHLNTFCFLIGKINSPVNLFMGFEGSLEITWRNKKGQLFDVEFYEDRIEYYFEKIEEESVIDSKDIKSLVDKIKTIY